MTIAKQEEANLAKDEADEVRSMKSTPNFSKKMKITKEHIQKKGELPYRSNPTKQLNCGKIGQREEEA